MMRNEAVNFGAVHYKIVTDVDHGKITAILDLPDARLVLHLRHPKSAAIKSVTVNGMEWKAFNPENETIGLQDLTSAATATARY